MLKLLGYFGRFQALRGNLSGLPSWARFVLLVLALPGIALILLSILALLVSILALLLLTVPAFRFLRAVTGAGEAGPGLPLEAPGINIDTADTVETVDAAESTARYEPAQVVIDPSFMDAPRRATRRHIDVKIVE